MSSPRRAPALLAARDRWTVALVTIGGVLLPVLGWVLGVLLLWTSKRWGRREKLLGTLVLPGGLLPAVLLVSGAYGDYHTLCSSGLAGEGEVCTGGRGMVELGSGWALVVALVLLPLLTAATLARRPDQTQVAPADRPGA